MANEITLTIALNVSNGNLVIDKSPPTFQLDQSSQGYSAGVQIIGTTQEQIVIGSDVTSPGVSYWRNLDATNYVELGLYISSTFYPFKLIKPGEAWPFRIASGATLYAKAHTAPVKLENLILAD